MSTAVRIIATAFAGVVIGKVVDKGIEKIHEMKSRKLNKPKSNNKFPGAE